MKKLLFQSVVLGLLLVSSAKAQTPRFYQEIQAFKQQDSLHFPPANAILFVGSSSFQKWKDVQDYFPNHIIINRGFGGSTLPDVIRYAPDIILPYHPKQIVIYCGENDIAEDPAITPQQVLERVKILLQIIRKKYKNIPVDYISIKPSPSRIQWQQKMAASNTLIQKYLQQQPHTRFIDVYHAMLNLDGTINETIFIHDRLHMNATGYHIWQKILEPYLL
ncbi:MAG: G-D-S-L family lipolytic protein [Sphingobacteriales bacterium]|uniref:GDSL-type esterase/lipase family protein n=1 Tax=Hydrotalea flava TaxID=714549 RepID=UPI00082C7043|nr:GDSL-type esterase/lipase family protein [Hydrotalea flava]RTL52360.1 MAG: G-D-S-L family lipolytic protein [Sphingobacteriales bacterium]